MPDPTTLPMLSDAEWKALDDAAMSGKYGITPMGGSPSPPIPDSGGLPSMPSRSVAPLPATQEANIAAGTKLQPGVGKEMYARGLPSITAPPTTPEYDVQKLERGDYQQIHPWGSQVSEHPGTGGKIAHVLSKIGNVAGDIVAPSTMALIPGTDLNKRMERGGELRQFGRDVESQEKEAQTGLLGAEAFRQMHPIDKVKETIEDDKGNEWEVLESGAIRPAAAGSTQLQGKPIQPVKMTEDQGLAEAIANAQKRGVDPMQDPDVKQRLAVKQAGEKSPTETEEEQAYDQWLKDHPGQKMSRLDFHGKYSPPNQIPLIVPTTGQLGGTFNPRTGTETEKVPGATTAAGAGVANKQVEEFNKEYVNPAEAAERSYQLFQDAYNAVKRGDTKTGAEDMLMLSQHLGTTFGQVKGSRMNKDLIQEHKNAIGIEDRIERFGNQLASGQQLSPDQREEFSKLITDFRNLTWQMTVKEGVRRGQKIDFVPSNVQIKLKAPDGSERPVTGDRVQYYIDKGAKIAF